MNQVADIAANSARKQFNMSLRISRKRGNSKYTSKAFGPHKQAQHPCNVLTIMCANPGLYQVIVSLCPTIISSCFILFGISVVSVSFTIAPAQYVISLHPVNASDKSTAAMGLSRHIGHQRWRHLQNLACFAELLKICSTTDSRQTGKKPLTRYNTNCCICLRSLGVEKSTANQAEHKHFRQKVILRCGHTFHQSCILQSILQHANQCPLCKEVCIRGTDCILLEQCFLGNEQKLII